MSPRPGRRRDAASLDSCSGQSGRESSKSSSSRGSMDSHRSGRTASRHPYGGGRSPRGKAFNFVEACCVHKTILSSKKFLASGFNCTRIGIKQGFSQSDEQLAIDKLRGPGDVLWVSPPCAADDQFPQLVRNTWEAGRGPAPRKIDARMWRTVERVIDVATARGCTVIVEWPAMCDYWSSDQVVTCLERCRFGMAHMDGCMVGLTSGRCGQGGRLLHKRWSLAVSHKELTPYLTYVCKDRDHDCCVSAGWADATRPESYTEDFATVVMHALMAQRNGLI